MINIILILFMLLFLFKSYLCINIKNQIIMDENKQKVNELTMRTLGSHYTLLPRPVVIAVGRKMTYLCRTELLPVGIAASRLIGI